jgi:hypothetical protein
MLDKLSTYIVWCYKTIRSSLLRELTASQLVAIATRGDTGSHNRLDLIQSLVAPFFYHHSVVIQHLVSDTLYQTSDFR